MQIVFPKNEAENEAMARLVEKGEAANGAEDMFLRPPHADRKCLREPIVEINLAAEMLNEAVTAHLAGHRVRAAELLFAANMPVLRDWLQSLWGKKSPYVMYRMVAKAEPLLNKADRIGSRMPTMAEKRTLLIRDHYHCRFCGIPVVRAEIRKKLHQLYPDAVTWDTASDQSQHAAFQVMWAQYDHVLPHSRGGLSALDNLVITCAGCNFGRMEHTLAEVGLIDPRLREPEASDWDGLERLLAQPQ